MKKIIEKEQYKRKVFSFLVRGSFLLLFFSLSAQGQLEESKGKQKPSPQGIVVYEEGDVKLTAWVTDEPGAKPLLHKPEILEGISKTEGFEGVAAFRNILKEIHLFLKYSTKNLHQERMEVKEIALEAIETLDIKTNEMFSFPGAINLRAGEIYQYIAFNNTSKNFSPGKYQFNLKIEGREKPLRVPFTIVPEGVLAEKISRDAIDPGINIARAVLGGKVLSVSSNKERTKAMASSWTYLPEYLIDGFMRMEGDFNAGSESKPTAAGWKASRVFPQEIVFSFYEGKSALINALVLHLNRDGMYDSWEIEKGERTLLPKYVEILVSDTEEATSYRKVVRARLHNAVGQQLIRFEPIKARFVKIRILENVGGPTITYPGTTISEVEIFEDAVFETSIVNDQTVNLALPALGGRVVSFTSQHQELRAYRLASELVDGTVSEKTGWKSFKVGESVKEGEYQPASYLPQQFVFAFHKLRIAHIDKVILNPLCDRSGGAATPRRISISVSTNSLKSEDFEEIGKFSMTKDPVDQSFPINRYARFVKVQILENHGGKSTALGEIKIMESKKPGHPSVLDPTYTLPQGAVPRSHLSMGEENDRPLITDVLEEVEPNNDFESAQDLARERYTKGMLHSPKDKDFYRIPIVDTPKQLTVDIAGEPFIKGAVTLLNEKGEELERFQSQDMLEKSAEISAYLEPGNYYLRVEGDPVAVLLAWDAGPRLELARKEVEKAVRKYMEGLLPGERMNLMRFGHETEFLLEEFSHDQKTLQGVLTKEVFEKMRGSHYAALYDAIAVGLNRLSAEPGTKALILVSDGINGLSKLNVETFWQTILPQPVRIYSVAIGPHLDCYMYQFGSTGAEMMRYFAKNKMGEVFFAASEKDIAEVYAKIAEEIRGKGTYYLKPSLSEREGLIEINSLEEKIRTVSVETSPRFEVILDASGSMREKIEGKTKMQIAKEAFAKIIKELPEECELAVRVFGNTIREGQKGDCQDTQLLVPFTKGNREEIMKKINAIEGLGTTLIAHSLRQVSEDILEGKKRTTVILITDGKEECGGDPVAAVKELREEGFEVRLDVIGFALAEEEVKQVMREAAEAAEGTYYDAGNAKELTEKMKEAMSTPSVVRYLRDGKEVARNELTKGKHSLSVPQGRYVLEIEQLGEPLIIRDVEVVHGSKTRIDLRKRGEKISVNLHKPLPQDGKNGDR